MKSNGTQVEAKFTPLGDAAATVSWPQLSDDQVLAAIQATMRSLLQEDFSSLRAVVRGWSTVTVHYDPCRMSWSDIVGFLRDITSHPTEGTTSPAQCLIVPVCFDGEHALDLAAVAANQGIAKDKWIERFASVVYTVRMIGFAPGFPYLAGLPASLHLPRRSTPRLRVPAGSVAIGGSHAGIYPHETPGGWHIIGRTSIRLFRPDKLAPSLLQPSDQIRFQRISRAEFSCASTT